MRTAAAAISTTSTALDQTTASAVVAAIMPCLGVKRHADVKLASLTALMMLCPTSGIASKVTAGGGMGALLALADDTHEAVRNSAALAIGRLLGAVPEEVRQIALRSGCLCSHNRYFVLDRSLAPIAPAETLLGDEPSCRPCVS